MGLKVLSKDKIVDKVCIILGTRPGLIKQGTIIRELTQQSVPFFSIHTGQHYSYELDRAFFVDLELPEPDFRLTGIKECKLHGEQTGEMLKQIEQILVSQKPKVVLVGGDANSNLAGALATRKLNLLLAHDESGLRSYEWNVPEEHNRVIIDHIADFLFAPHARAKEVLESEKVRGKILVTGSTICNAVSENLNIAKRNSAILTDLGIFPEKYILMTLHHEENVDYQDELSNILAGIFGIAEKYQLPIIFPIHPRTRMRLKHFGFEDSFFANPWIKVIDPLGYFNFLMLLAHARLVMTDSGGLIQESAIMHVPCLTLGKYTEWTETVEVGANLISMNDPQLMIRHASHLIDNPRDWPNPYGPPEAAKRIVNILKDILYHNSNQE